MNLKNLWWTMVLFFVLVDGLAVGKPRRCDDETGALSPPALFGEEYPTPEEVDLARLDGGALRNLVSALLEGRANCWSRVYAIRIKLEPGAANVAEELGLRPLRGSKYGGAQMYRTAWSVEKIARATKYPGLVSIFLDSRGN